EFTARRAKTIEYVKTTGDDLRVHVVDGPAGKMDAYQFLILLASHSVRHTEQIKEVEANANYPKSGMAAAAGTTYLVAYMLKPGVRLDKLTPDQLAKVQAHGAYLQSQMKKGVLLWGGRTTDPVHPHGYVEITASSPAGAQA